MDEKTFTDLEKLAKLCRKHGINSLKSGDTEIVLAPMAPPSNYKKKQSDVVIADRSPTYSAEDSLFWSSAGIPEAN